MSAQILVRHGIDHKAFREEILPAGQPVILKDLVKDWPAVRAGLDSPRALADYLRGFDRGKQVAVLEGPPSIRGHFFYREDMRGMNFERRPGTISATIERLLAQAGDPGPAALYVESTPTQEHLPPFAGENPNPLLPPTVTPRIWLGNQLVVQTHFDLSSNIACVAGGRRRFTLFPPDQVANLYVGPIEFNISGPPISMVPLRNPDLARFPRFADALAASQSAELTPGDAIFIPYGWWHHVEALEPFNVLVNYWWRQSPAYMDSPIGALMFTLMTVRDLPPAQRAAWQNLFRHYVFEADAGTVAHIPEGARRSLGALTDESAREIRARLLGKLNR